MKAAITTMTSKIELIKSLISEKGVTKAKVAERCGIDPATLSRLLNGHPVTQVRGGKVDDIIAYLESVVTTRRESRYSSPDDVLAVVGNLDPLRFSYSASLDSRAKTKEKLVITITYGKHLT